MKKNGGREIKDDLRLIEAEKKGRNGHFRKGASNFRTNEEFGLN